MSNVRCPEASRALVGQPRTVAASLHHPDPCAACVQENDRSLLAAAANGSLPTVQELLIHIDQVDECTDQVCSSVGMVYSYAYRHHGVNTE
jgi:hypothetical protein